MFEQVITAGALASLVLEGLKWLIRTLKKQPEFDFAPLFYAVLTPVLNLLMTPVLAFLLIEGYIYPASWVEFARLLVVTALGSLISFTTYGVAIKPLKQYKRLYG